MSTQVTAELILEDAYQNRDRPLARPEQTIQDVDELRSFQLTKRKEYEQQLNKNRLNYGQWVRYAQWEVAHNHDYARARSIYERALLVNVEHVPFWTHYIRMELASGNVNHARNLLERAVTTLPRVDKFWYLYAQTEEQLGNYEMVRVVFERWLTWQPAEGCWDSYIAFERRYRESERARGLYVRYVRRFGQAAVWLKWANFEASVDEGYVRSVFETAVDTLLPRWLERGGDDDVLAALVDKWARWEVAEHELARAHAIYTELFKLISQHESRAAKEVRGKLPLYQAYTEFAKAFGTADQALDGIVRKRLLQYQHEVAEDPLDYDTWWLYITLKISAAPEGAAAVFALFDAACSHVPHDATKTVRWRRYIYLWIRYALYAELEAHDAAHARRVWQRATEVPLYFGKVWTMYAEFELRHGDAAAGRKVLGRAVGRGARQHLAKRKVFQFYIDLERRWGQWDRCRKLYEKWLLVAPSREVLLRYIEFEQSLDEHPRVQGLYAIGVELGLGVWRQYVEYCQEEADYERARSCMRRVAAAARDDELAAVWIAMALFESQIPSPEQLEHYEASGKDELEFEVTEAHRQRTRDVFRQAVGDDTTAATLRATPHARAVVLEAWKSYEQAQGTEATLALVARMMPVATARHGDSLHIEYVFPADAQSRGVGKFLQNAQRWLQSTK